MGRSDRLQDWIERRRAALWAGGCAEMPLREMQIGGRFLQVAMPEQHLDGPQVGAGFE